MGTPSEDRLRQLEEKVRLCRAAVQDFVADVDAHSTIEPQAVDVKSRDVQLEELGDALVELYNFSGRATPLEEAICAYEDTLKLRPLGHGRHVITLDDLGRALWRFCTSVKRDDARLQRAISCHREALQLCQPGHPARDVPLNNLAIALRTCFHQQGHVEILDEVISLNRQSLLLCPPGHPTRDMSLNNLAIALCDRFEKQGDWDALVEAIALHRGALQLRPDGHPDRAMSANNLATALLDRFHQQGGLDDLNEVVTLHQCALQMRPPGHPTRSTSLHNLATALLSRFQSVGDLNILAEVIALHREALQLHVLGHPGRESSLSNLANSLLVYYHQTGDPSILDGVIFMHRAALELQPPGHPARDMTLNNLANALRTLFKQQSDPDLLVEALLLYGEALHLRPPGHRGHAWSSCSIGCCLLIPRSNSFDFDRGVAYISEALVDNNASFRDRLAMAQSGLHAVDEAFESISKAADETAWTQRGRDVLRLYNQAIQLLPRAANLGLHASTRLQALARSDQIACSAAARALILGQLSAAVETLEEGRGVFWSQALQLRASGLDNVPKQDADDLKGIFAALQSDVNLAAYATASSEERERALEARRLLNMQAEALIARIRTYPGLDRFLLPPTFESLMSSLPSGFVVILNASRLGAHALLLHRATGLAKSMEIAHAIENLDLKGLRARLPRDMGVPSPPTSPGVETETRLINITRRPSATAPKFEDTLKTLWLSIVRPILTSLGLKKAGGDDRPRVWWCATSDFGFLPIHAAGDYGSHGDAECTSDYVVSSYTPTLFALLKARSGWQPVPVPQVSGLVIGESSSGQSYLPNVQYEVEVVRECFAAAGSQVLNPPSDQISRNDVQRLLAELPPNILHLASHGTQDSDPLQSAFVLKDSKLSIQDMMAIDLPHAVLAFLSACETAKGDKKAPDQAVHLAASMLFCGFKSVIGTMWLMDDADGPSVARRVYERLFEKGQLDLDDVPYALDDAVRMLRGAGVPAERWALYVHMGG